MSAHPATFPVRAMTHDILPVLCRDPEAAEFPVSYLACLRLKRRAVRRAHPLRVSCQETLYIAHAMRAYIRICRTYMKIYPIIRD